MGTANGGLLDGVRRIPGRFRDLVIDGGLPGAPLGLRVRGALQAGPPVTGTWRAGDVLADRSGVIWSNILGGTPGRWSGTLVGVGPSGDPSGVRDTAAINAVAQSGRVAALMPGGSYTVGNLLPDSLGGIIGNGATVTAAPGTTGYLLALKTPAATKQVLVRDLVINCNQVCGGVQLDNTGFTPAGSFVPYDPLHVLDNLLVLAASGDAFHFDNQARELRVSKCRQYFATGYGFYLGTGAGSSGAACTDSHFTDCTSGQSGNHGFYLAAQSGNNMLVSCKAFYSGYNEATATWGTTECGFEVAATNVSVTACSAQQSALHGFDLNGCTSVSMAGCESDTNSAGTSGGVGVNTNGALNCAVIGTTGSNNGSLTPGGQQYGIQVNGTQTGTVFMMNTVTGSSGAFNYAGGFGYTFIDQASQDWSQSSFTKVPALILAADTAQAVTNGYTILTVSDGNYAAVPLTATAACTGLIFQAPANAWTQVTLVNQSAFTMTFAASGTSGVDGGTSVVIPPLAALPLVYDGNLSLWVPTAPPAFYISGGQAVTPLPVQLAAGTTAAAPLNFASGTLETTAAAGAAEFDGTAFYATAAASSRQVVNTEQFTALSAAYTLANSTSAQKLFNATANGTLTVQGSTTYYFECEFDITGLSASTHQVEFGFGGTATFTSLKYAADANTGAAGTLAAWQTIVVTSATATALMAAGTTTTFQARVKGVIRVNGAGTIIPQVTQLTNAAAASVTANSWFRIWPAGSGTVAAVGNWS